jgi:hypothetical protein
MVLTGLHLVTSWLLVIVLAELSKRDAAAELDLGMLTTAAGGNDQETKRVKAMASLTS